MVLESKATASAEDLVAAERRGPTMKEAREILRGLFDHRPGVYWIDFLISVTVAWGALAGAISRTAIDFQMVACIVISSFALLRAVLFLHEITHFRRGVMPGFQLIWDLLVGVPMLLPSFMYVGGAHTDHHKRHLYGTIKDPEYLPLGFFSRWRIMVFLLETLFVPLLLILRFGLLAPVSWLLPPLRRLLIERASTLVINVDFRRRQPSPEDNRRWLALEVMMFTWVVGVVWMLTTGVLPLRALGIWYAMAAFMALINQFRTLTAHLYENDGAGMSTEAQLLDSVNVRGCFGLTELVFPVGLKYHALHHFVPDMPYHSLAEAHQRLMKSLPVGSLYRDTEYAGGIAVLLRFWRHGKNGGAAPAAWKRTES
ncbi:MAG: fatty acid desaturase [Planctomycetota bacterium]